MRETDLERLGVSDAVRHAVSHATPAPGWSHVQIRGPWKEDDSVSHGWGPGPGELVGEHPQSKKRKRERE